MPSSMHPTILVMAAFALASAQEAVDLDAVADAPAAPRRAGDGIKVGDLKFNVHFDGGLAWSKGTASNGKSDVRFMQEHASLFARAATPDGIEVYADIVNPGEVFEATIPLRFFASSLEGVPVLGEAAIKGGRMIVPFGDFEDHPIYGGSVSNSRLLREVVWSDYGMGLVVPVGFSRTELYVVNGVSSSDSSVWFTSAEELNAMKGVGCRIRVDPTPWLFASASAFLDHPAIGPNELYTADSSGNIVDSITVDHNSTRDRAMLLGLDAGMRTGPLSWRAGGAKAWITARYGGYDYAEHKPIPFNDYSKWGWYAESKWRIDDTWALRLRGGQVDPDSRTIDDNDQTNVNLGVIWSKGPVDARLTYFRNLETHWLSDSERPNSKHRVLLETFVTL